MNPPTADEAVALGQAVEAAAGDAPDVTTVICPPTIWLTQVAAAVAGIEVGAQTMHFEERGAHTGETSPLMLIGLSRFVILGHSERRQDDGETDESVGRKVASAVAMGCDPSQPSGSGRRSGALAPPRRLSSGSSARRSAGWTGCWDGPGDRLRTGLGDRDRRRRHRG